MLVGALRTDARRVVCGGQDVAEVVQADRLGWVGRADGSCTVTFPVVAAAAFVVVAALRAVFLAFAEEDVASRLVLESTIRSAPFFKSVVGRSCHNRNWSNCRLRAAGPVGLYALHYDITHIFPYRGFGVYS